MRKKYLENNYMLSRLRYRGKGGSKRGVRRGFRKDVVEGWGEIF